MRSLIISIILLLLSTYAVALEQLTEPEMKNATGQLASVAGDVGGTAGDLGPLAGPVAPVIDIYDLVSPHVDPVSDISAASDSAAPVTRIVNVVGDVTVPFGFF